MILLIRSLTAAVLATCLLPLASVRSEEPETLDALLARIEKVPDDSSGLGEGEQAYVAKLHEHGDEAIPRLVALLTNPDEKVAELAASALGDYERIDPKYLPEVLAGLDRGNAGLASALGKIETDEAAKEAVKRYLAAKMSPLTQEIYAVKLQGARAIPYIIDAAKANDGKSTAINFLLGFALSKMSPAERTKAALALRPMLVDEHSSLPLVRGIVAIISALGEPGLILEPDLLALRRSQPELKEHIDLTFLGIGSTQSGRVYAEILKGNNDPAMLMNVAQIGKPARDAGEEVMKLLESPDWQVRRAAARALGFIGYDPAAPRLIAFLGDEEDVLLTWIAIQSLGRLEAKSAAGALGAVAAKHWHPAVRKEAETALAHLESSKPYERRFQDVFSFEFFCYDDFGIATDVSKEIPQAVKEPEELKMEESTSPERLKKLSFPNETLKNRDPQQRIRARRGTLNKYERSSIAYQSKRDPDVPYIALRVDGGWLAARDLGIEGDELIFIPDDSKPYIVLSENIFDLYTLGKKRIALRGVTFGYVTDGIVYELTQGADAQWKATPWRALPGAPQASAKTKSGEIFISTTRGGNILLSEDGTLRMAPESAASAAPSGESAQPSGTGKDSGSQN